MELPKEIESPALIKKSQPDANLNSIIFDNTLSNFQNFTLIYTDASKTIEGVGCAIITPTMIIKKKLPYEYSVFLQNFLLLKKQ